MRIPSGKTDQLIFFVAVDSTDLKTRETGLTTFTVYRSRNGGAATIYTTPTVAELSAANMPGVYSLAIDEDTTIAAGSDSEEYCVHITQAAMAPVTRSIELYRRDTTTGRTLAVDASSRALSDVDTIKTNPVVNGGTITFPTTATLASTTNITAGTITTTTNLTNLPAITANWLTAAGIAAGALNGKGDWNIGKTGYALSAAGVQAIWDALTSALTTVGSIGKLLVDNINATISSRSSHSAADVWASAARTLTAATNITSTGGATVPQTGDSFARLGAPAGANVSADIAAIKTQTDKLTFTVANQIDANIQSVNDVTVTGIGTAGSPWGP